MTRLERINAWRDVDAYSLLKASEGGESFASVAERLRDAGIPVRHAPSPYVGQYGLEVPKRYGRRAFPLIFFRG